MFGAAAPVDAVAVNVGAFATADAVDAGSLAKVGSRLTRGFARRVTIQKQIRAIATSLRRQLGLLVGVDRQESENTHIGRF